MAKKPGWWPQNPYPEDIFPMPREKYAEVIPDPHNRTALSGMLGREFWEIASESIWDSLRIKILDSFDEPEVIQKVLGMD